MTKRMKLAALATAMVLLAACGDPGGAGATTSTGDSAPTTTAADTSTTTSSPVTTTTTAPTTTTTAPSVDADAADLFASLQNGTEITSARMEGSIAMQGLDAATAGVSDATILFSTSFDTETGDTSFLMDMSSMMGDLSGESDDPLAGMFAGMMGEMEVRQIGDTVYLKFPLFTAMFGAETEWVSMPAEEGGDFTSDFETMPTDPGDLLGNFDPAGATVETVGSENVNGVDATHYKVELDVSAMEMTAEERSELEQSGIWAQGVIPVDLWVSDAGYMVRMIMEIDGSGLDLPADESFETMTLHYDFFDINEPVTIEAPPASEVTSMDDLESMFEFEG